MVDSVRHLSGDPHYRLQAVQEDYDEEQRRRRRERMIESLKTNKEGTDPKAFNIGTNTAPAATPFLKIKTVHFEEDD